MSTLTLAFESRMARFTQQTSRLRESHAQKRAWFAPVIKCLDFMARALFHVWRNRQYLTTVKLINMGLIQLSLYFKTEFVLGRPYAMKIESTNICNTKCQLCPTGLGFGGRDKGKMSLDKFQGLIDQFHKTLYTVDLSMWGDPLIVPEIYDMISHAHKRGIWTYISSNLHAFKLDPQKDQARKLVESGLDMLTCSLHGASQSTFEMYQPGKNFGDALEKVRHIVRTRNEMGSKTPVIQLNFVVTRRNEHERAEFQKLADELGCKAIFSAPSLNLRFMNKDKNLQSLGLAEDVLQKKIADHINHWLPRDENFVIKPYRELQKSINENASKETQEDPEQFNGKKIMDCSWPWTSAVINWDGSAVTCCGSWEPEEDMGNVFTHSFAEIWNGKKYRMARRSFKNKLTKEQACGVGCTNCPGFML